MPKRHGKARKENIEHAYYSIRVESYEVRVDASVNTNLRTFPPLFANDNDPVLDYVTSLEITGIAIGPEERAGDTYQITIRGEEDYASDKLLTLKDMQARDEHHMPMYKSRRGENYPVYRDFSGITTLNKRRGENLWDAWIPVSPRLASDMLMLLSGDRQLYLSIHERKFERKRWIESVSLQTTNPEEE